MSKYLSKSAAKRLPLSTKHARKGYYKGKGATTQGTFRGRAGRFAIDKNRLLELVVPNLEGFKVRACSWKKNEVSNCAWSLITKFVFNRSLSHISHEQFQPRHLKLLIK
jgi:hypothetical protein